MMELMVGLVQSKEKGANKDCFVFGFFSSKRSADAATDVGSDFIGLVFFKPK